MARWLLFTLFTFHAFINGHELNLFQAFFDEKNINSDTLLISRLPGFTNKNYLVEYQKEKYVFRIPGKQTLAYLDRKVEYHNTLLAQNFGFYPAKIIFFDINTGCQVSSFVSSCESLMWEDFYNPKVIEKATKLLKKIHASQIKFINRMNPFDRIEQLISSLEQEKHFISTEYRKHKVLVDNLKEQLISEKFELVPCHNDPVPSNYIITSAGLAMFDWEHSGLNDPAWDLAFLASVMDYSDQQIEGMIASYQPEDINSMYCRIVLYKPIVEFWLGLWAFGEILDQSTVEGKEFFLRFSNARLKKCKRYMASPKFMDAKKHLTQHLNQ